MGAESRYLVLRVSTVFQSPCCRNSCNLQARTITSFHFIENVESDLSWLALWIFSPDNSLISAKMGNCCDFESQVNPSAAAFQPNKPPSKEEITASGTHTHTHPLSACL